MASVTVQKWGTAAACRGQCVHVYREGKNYANPDIDRTKSACVWVMDDVKTCQKNIRETIAKIDKNRPPKRIKRDRKTVAELCVPAPREGTSQEDALRFFQGVYDELAATGYHVCGGAVHGDETHDYIDPDDKKLHRSRLHMHVLLVPETERGLNMKSWLTKNRFRELNALCDRVCKRELGHPYQDGSGRRSRGTVEALKEKSSAELLRTAEAVRNELPRLEASRDALRAQEEKSRQETANAAREAQEASRDALRAQEEKSRQETANAAREAQEARQRAQTELRELFPPGRVTDVLEEREYKTGLLSRERVLVATDPDAVASAVQRADAVARTLDNRDAERQEVARLREQVAQLTQERDAAVDRAAQEHFDAVLGRALTVPDVADQIRECSYSEHVRQQLRITAADAARIERVLREDSDRDRDAAMYQTIIQVSRRDRQLRAALVRSGVCPEIDRRQQEHSLSL